MRRALGPPCSFASPRRARTPPSSTESPAPDVRRDSCRASRAARSAARRGAHADEHASDILRQWQPCATWLGDRTLEVEVEADDQPAGVELEIGGADDAVHVVDVVLRP